MKTLISRQLSKSVLRGTKRPIQPIRRQASSSAIPDNLIHYEHDVRQALANGEPVVALESTIIGEYCKESPAFFSLLFHVSQFSHNNTL